MSSNRTPHPGQVYRSPDGAPMLYVRTEQRPGATEPEHLFMVTRNRGVFQLWVAEVPPEAELIIDADGRAEANVARFELLAREHQYELAFELLRQACAWLPHQRAEELRQRWRESTG